MSYQYSVYGLNITSDLELPELVAVEWTTADVEITIGPVPERLIGAKSVGEWAEYADGPVCLMRIPDVGRFLVESGRTIVVQPCGPDDSSSRVAASAADVRLYLLGSALAAILHQRGLLPLHVSAVLSEGGALAFTGPSGAGKSTMAGFLSQKMGLPLISDDVSVVSLANNMASLHSGPRKLKLWADAVDFLDLGNRQLAQDLSNTPKFQLYLPDKVAASAFPLRAVVFLERVAQGQAAELVPISGIDRFRACCQAVYRPYMAPWFRSKADYVRDVFNLAESIEMYKLRRPWALEQLDSPSSPLWQLFPSEVGREVISR